jgi:hypothetical protein
MTKEFRPQQHNAYNEHHLINVNGHGQRQYDPQSKEKSTNMNRPGDVEKME